jgi:outer membrane scaffolding protein for murein synthesis (MipA/OmpV family)
VRASPVLLALISACLLRMTPVAAEDWNVGIGAGVISYPEYIGAEDNDTLAIPAIDVAYKDRVFFNFFEGLTGYFYSAGDFRLKAGLGWEGGRDEDDDAALEGTGDIDDAAVLSLTTEYQLGQYTAFARFEQHYGGTDGRQLIAGVQAFYSLREDLASPRLLANFAINYSDDDYLQGYFGVDADQSADSGIPEYTARAGVVLMRAGLTYVHPLTDHWRFTAVVQYSKLVGDAADSPLVADDRQVFGGAFVGYRY